MGYTKAHCWPWPIPRGARCICAVGHAPSGRSTPASLAPSTFTAGFGFGAEEGAQMREKVDAPNGWTAIVALYAACVAADKE